MHKEEIYDFLKKNNIWFEVTEHKAVYNMDDLKDVDMPYPSGNAKNLFIRDDKKINYYLITINAHKKVDLKSFREANNTRPLTFAKEEELTKIIKLKPGSVTPFGILNDSDRKVKFFIDKELTGENHIIGVHPNDNTATIWLQTKDLINIIQKHGNEIKIIDI